MAYCKWVSERTEERYRLPSEAEWEYAAGNGSDHTRYSWGNGDPTGRRGGNVADETAQRTFSSWTIFEGYTDGFVYTAPVGSFQENEYGLFDMTGNVWEWCSDWYASDYYDNSPSRNPQGPSSGDYRVIRGGSWNGDPQGCRAASRGHGEPTLRYNFVGFRLAR